jgi:hypothetical protein
LHFSSIVVRPLVVVPIASGPSFAPAPQRFAASSVDGANAVVSRFVYSGEGLVPEYRSCATYRLVTDQGKIE